MKLNGKIALVTGGGRGIGKAIALALAREGADIAVVSRTRREIAATAADVSALGQRSLPIEADVSDKRDVARMVKRTLEEFGRVDILVNNAGILGPIGPLVENDTEDWIKTININLVGTFLCCKAVLPVMMKQQSGKIINLSGWRGYILPPPFYGLRCVKNGNSPFNGNPCR